MSFMDPLATGTGPYFALLREAVRTLLRGSPMSVPRYAVSYTILISGVRLAVRH